MNVLKDIVEITVYSTDDLTWKDFFGVPLVLAIIHSVFGIQFAITIMSGLASKKDLLPSTIATVIIIGIIYGAYFLATYLGSRNIIKEE